MSCPAAAPINPIIAAQMGAINAGAAFNTALLAAALDAAVDHATRSPGTHYTHTSTPIPGVTVTASVAPLAAPNADPNIVQDMNALVAAVTLARQVFNVGAVDFANGTVTITFSTFVFTLTVVGVQNARVRAPCPFVDIAVSNLVGLGNTIAINITFGTSVISRTFTA
jgi:hypothetical protein